MAQVGNNTGIPVPTEVLDALSLSRQKAHVTSVESAKAEETRARRVAKVVAELSGR